MKSDWQYVQINGTNEKMAPKTLVENVFTSENGPSLMEVMPSNPNLLINGDFQVWQRGTSFPSIGSYKYSADRWISLGSGFSVEKHATACMATVYNPTGTYQCIGQYIEHNNELNGKTVTLSAEVYASNAPIMLGIEYIRDGVRTIISEKTNFPAGTTGIISITTTMPFLYYSDALRVRAGFGNVSSGSITLKWIKLEIGGVATPNSPRTYQHELAACQRYFCNLNIDAQYCWIGLGQARTATQIIGIVNSPVTMRDRPVISNTVNYANVFCRNGGTSLHPTDIAIDRISANSIPFVLTVSGATVGAVYEIYLTSYVTIFLDSEIYP